MKTNRIFILISALFLSITFMSCGVDPTTIELLTTDEIVAKMNNTFDGTFTVVSEDRKPIEKSVTVNMTCTLADNTSFDVVFSEKHKRVVPEFGTHYYDDDSCYTTNYYSKRYETELKTNLEQKILDWFEGLVSASGLTTVSSDAYLQINQSFASFESFLDYYKKNCKASYRIVVPFEKGSNSNFDVYRKAMNYQHDIGKDFQWVSGTIIYGDATEESIIQ